MGFGDIVDVLTDFIPGGDVIDDFLGIGNGKDGLLQGLVATVPKQSANGRPAATANGESDAALYNGCRIRLPLQYRQVAYAPPGYVVVDEDRDGVPDTAMLKEVAIACKLWKRRPKPLLTASDRKVLNKASSVMKKVDTVVGQTNQIRGQAKLTKSKPRARK